MKKILRASFVLLLLVGTFLSLNDVKALSQGDTFFVWKRGDIDQTSNLKNARTGQTVTSSYVVYTENGLNFPAYCNDVSKKGVGGAENRPGYNITATRLAEDAVWRVISNGFPYRTPAQLGVANEYDAFVATKHATYVALGQSSIGVYAGKNARGDKIVAAMRSLLNKPTGITGLTSYHAPNFKVTASSVTEEGNYAVMVLTGSSSPIVVDKLDVTLKGNVPAGTKITDIKGNVKKTFTNNEQIKVMVPKNSVKGSTSFDINLNARFATYRIYLGKAPSSNLQDYYMTTDKYEYASSVKQFNYTKKEENRTCDDINKEYQKCEKDNSCSKELIKEYNSCNPKKTCDDINKEYQKCEKDNSCSKELINEYEKCNPKKTCDDINKEYQKCEKDNSCSKELIKEYNSCNPKKTCDDINKEYQKCEKDNSCSKELIKEYNSCNPKKTCDDINKEYQKCEKDNSCSKELIKEYITCNPKKTCDDINKEYQKCEKDNSCSEKLTTEYKACISNRTCDDIISDYKKCEKNGTCSEKLKEEYIECTPVYEEINPNTSGMNILLTSLVVLSAGGTGVYAYRKRKLFDN